jgi:hypothetical protein
MISFACPTCQTKLSVKDELAGQKTRCPGCGQAAAIPAHSVPATLIPPPAPGATAGEAVTQPPATDAEATLGADRPDRSLTAFLAPPQAADELGRLGKYRVLKVLGHGGMGVVFQAEDPRLRRKVAIKAILPGLAASASAGQRFLREAQAMAALKHDHVATIYQVDEEGGVPFLAMEFLAGEPLNERLQRDRKLPLPEVLRIGREIAEGLEAAHASGLVHRDVKPANVWLEAPRGRVKILDFGLARVAAQDDGLTQQGAILGTPAYMAPEQVRGEAVDGRCDLFSLGVVLYRLCTGEQPFKGRDTVSTLTEVATHQPPAPARLNPDVPPELSGLVMRLLEKDAGRRPASAGEVAEALRNLEERWGREDTVQFKPEQPAARARTGRKRQLLVLAASVALVPLGWLAAVVLRVETANGTLVVEMNDAEAEARIKGGKLILTGPDDKIRYTLSPGERNKQIDAGTYKVRVEGADGLTLDTPEFTLRKGGKVVVRVTAAPGAVAEKSNPDRTAAEWVLSVGGIVLVNGEDRGIGGAADLLPKVFRLTGVILDRTNMDDAGLAHLKDCKGLTQLHLNNTKLSDAGLAHFKDWTKLTHLGLGGTQVSDTGLAYFKDCKGLVVLGLDGMKISDAGLANFKDCKGLTFLKLIGTKVGDVGLANFKDCKALTYLGLDGTQVSDAGLAPFKDCKSLTALDLSGTQVGDAGLAHFKDCKGLTFLKLIGTKVGDAGMANFRDCKRLTYLGLDRTQVSDAGLANFADCQALTVLGLANTRVGDAGLAHFKGCKDLRELFVQDTPVSDAGLVCFKGCKGLRYLGLKGTKVTTAKVEELKRMLPECKIEWDGGL